MFFSRETVVAPSSGGEWSKVRRLHHRYDQWEFMLSWEIVGKATTLGLILVLNNLSFWVGNLVVASISFSWALVMTSYYEYRVSRGLKEVFAAPDRGGHRPLLSWLVFVFKTVLFLGVNTVLLTHFLCWIHRQIQRWVSNEEIGRKIFVRVAMCLSGIIPTRYFLVKGGYSGKKVYLLNLEGRLWNTPFRVLQLNGILQLWILVFWALFSVYRELGPTPPF